MKSVSKAARSLAAVLCLVLLGAITSAAQTVTTGNLSGVITDAQGGVLPGAAILATHTPTGTTYEAVSDSDGRFNILNVRVGPYSVSVSMSGFRKEEIKDLSVGLGETRTIPFKLQIETVAETVEVVAQSLLIDSSVAGTADNISNQVKEALPTITRSIADIVRISPLFSSQGGGSGADASVVSVAGNSFRYNGLQIDGAANNDLFGLAGSAGTPGGAAETQPISLDAIQEIQLVVSPYDVRQGGFSGGGINAITKSGIEQPARHRLLLRPQPGLGRRRRRRPSGVDVPATSRAAAASAVRSSRTRRSSSAPRTTVARRGRRACRWGRAVSNSGAMPRLSIASSLSCSRYGYSPGSNPKNEFISATDNDKYFFRGDFNVARGHQLTVRHNYIDALQRHRHRDHDPFRFPDAFYRYQSQTNSTVGQLNSTFGSKPSTSCA